jgi:purine-binding chemotaxis protein CheW
VLVVLLDEVRCGLAVNAIREVARAVEISPLPSAPRGVEGVVDYHGTVIPVVDLRDRLGLPAHDPRSSDHFIVADTGSRVCGFRVDEAIGLAELAPSDLIDVHDIIAGARPVAGVARTRDGLALLQDLAAMLSQAEEEQLSAAMARSHGDTGAE